MKGQDLITQIQALMDRYGPDVEFFCHGPAGKNELLTDSGFGPEMNWAAGKVALLSEGGKEEDVLTAVFMYGLPLHLGGGPLQYPMKTNDIPIYHFRQKGL